MAKFESESKRLQLTNDSDCSKTQPHPLLWQRQHTSPPFKAAVVLHLNNAKSSLSVPQRGSLMATTSGEICFHGMKATATQNVLFSRTGKLWQVYLL